MLSLPCTHLKNVGDKTAELLKKCSISTIQDLLFHLPFRYQDKTQVTPINQLIAGTHAVIEGNIIDIKTTRGRKPALICYAEDATGIISLRFFNFSLTQKKQFHEGGKLRCFGEVRFWNHEPEIIHPEYRFVKSTGPIPLNQTLTPVYPTTEGLHQNLLRRLTTQALELLEKGGAIPELIPTGWLQKFSLPTLINALHYVHRPPCAADIKNLEQGLHPAQQRLVLEEMLAQNLSLRRVRKNLQLNLAPICDQSTRVSENFLANLAFKLTSAQERVLQEITNDMHQKKPMLRLVQGDVGSGKTVVAALTMLKAVENGFQAALMAPTELLAEQHFRQFQTWFKPLGIEVAYLTSQLSTKIKKSYLTDISSGKSQLIIGTHALFQADVDFKSLGAVVIDEQHRFGVHQRLALWQKGVMQHHVPHQLILTATPIPRTLAMVFYADLDVSIIDELPPGRTPITTVVIPAHRRDEITERIRRSCSQGKQAYWVCPLIEESELLQCQAVEATTTMLKETIPEISIGLVHGRMKAQDKEITMQAFREGAIDLLVATTVIEVGVDVPNASLMIIENAERLGLSQLHQLRGRIGRGAITSYCVLLYQEPLSQQAQTRLAMIRKSQDGFAIAQQDLELRGPGELLGTKQTGAMRFRIANLVRDQHWLPHVQEISEQMLKDHPEQVELLVQRWVGANDQYGLV